jgi:hypothetical protein
MDMELELKLKNIELGIKELDRKIDNLVERVEIIANHVNVLMLNPKDDRPKNEYPEFMKRLFNVNS